MNKILTAFLAAVIIIVSLSGCAATKEEIGGVTGAVVGGVVGAQVGRGHGRDAATVIGSIIGAVVGSKIGRHLDEYDEMRAQRVLEYNPTGQYTNWANPDTDARVAMVPTRTYQTDAGQYCREYQTEVTIGSKREKAYGTACRQPDGSWKIQK